MLKIIYSLFVWFYSLIVSFIYFLGQIPNCMHLSNAATLIAVVWDKATFGVVVVTLSSSEKSVIRLVLHVRMSWIYRPGLNIPSSISPNILEIK